MGCMKGLNTRAACQGCSHRNMESIEECVLSSVMAGASASESSPTAVQWSFYGTTALAPKKNVLMSNCPRSEVPVQSECSDRLQIALSLHQECPYIKHFYKEKLLYLKVTRCQELCIPRLLNKAHHLLCLDRLPQSDGVVVKPRILLLSFNPNWQFLEHESGVGCIFLCLQKPSIRQMQ